MIGALIIERSEDFVTSSAAVFDFPRKRYRYLLTRRWGSGHALVFLMLNPSTADADLDDNTISKCLGFARRLGFNALIVVNLFALRATDPAELDGYRDPVGPWNDAIVQAVCQGAPLVIAAWGAHEDGGRADAVRKLLAGVDLHCLAVTKAGHPGHPLYLPGTSPLMSWPAAA